MSAKPKLVKFQPVLIRMPPELHQAAKGRAEKEDRSMSSLFRVALRRYLDENGT